jgi:hypothetical protein
MLGARIMTIGSNRMQLKDGKKLKPKESSTAPIGYRRGSFGVSFFWEF